MAEKEERVIRLSTSDPGDRELTFYIKGFLARGESADHFGVWLASHQELVEALGWGKRAYGYGWRSGDLESIPMPLLSSVAAAWSFQRRVRKAKRFTALSSVGVVAAEEIVQMVARFVYQYRVASSAAEQRAEVLAERLAKMRKRYRHLRLVAHSLGCRHVIEAVSLLDPASRPDEIHLCAPACRERDVSSKLDGLALGTTYLYYTRSDLVLDVGFRVLSRGSALGAAGPKRSYVRLKAVDVKDEFGFWVHAEYKRRFPRLANRD